MFEAGTIAACAMGMTSFWKKRAAILVLVAMVVLTGCDDNRHGDSLATVAGDSSAGAAADWTAPGGAADEAGYSRLREIDAANVARLGLSAYTELPGEASLEATPLAIDGVLYFSGSHAAVYAVNGSSGKLLWKFDPQVWKHHPQKMNYAFGVNRGTAYADGRIFVGAEDGRLFALDAKTGDQLWSVQTVPLDSAHSITGAPRTFNGKVIIGNSGADYGMRGYVTAYDQKTGKELWRFYTVPGSPEENKGNVAMERAAATWSGEYWKTGTGGTVWNGMTFDPEFNRIYIGTSNGGPYDPAVRSPGDGDNLYLASMVALDADTGAYLWHYQVNPREAWDYKATANMITATLNIGGRPRKVLMQAPTNGFFYVLDRENGKLISAGKTGKVTWAERIDLQTGRPVEHANIRYETGEAVIWPSMMGTHNWQAMSFNPETGLAYIPFMHMGVRFKKSPPGPGDASYGGLSINAAFEDERDGTGALLAWDPVRQAARWSVPFETMWNGGTLTTAGGLVFQGTGDGYFAAYDASTGERLWRFNAGLGIIGAPMSFAIDGTQHVAILVGYGGAAAIWSDVMHEGWKYGAQPRRLLIFRLDGSRKLPPSPPAVSTVNAVDDPALQIREEDVTAGEVLFAMRCAVCHGLHLQSAGSPGPDLRESGIALSLESMYTVLHDGTLLERGMPRFEELTREQVRQIHGYIRAGAREVLGTRKPQDPSGGSGVAPH